ncbi:hypothetical protein [Ornithinibacillus xuwenensis]|uniref:Uncharacterized protein n=1 Tax=Ornithinibacillus xuwenensis TaxID=3144668 RepID=A0ABU9XFF9_9BACI
MVKITIKSNKSFRITIPLPYFALHIATSIVCSNFVWNKIVKIEGNPTSSIYPPINKQLIKPLLKNTIKEIQTYRGITIVELKEQNGAEVLIKL